MNRNLAAPIWVLGILFFLLVFEAPNCPAQDVVSANRKKAAKLIDAYIDRRHDGTHQETIALFYQLKQLGFESASELESLLRGPRAAYPDTEPYLGKTTAHDVECLHVDYASKFLMFVPKELDTKKPVALVVVGHGGNSSMSPERAESTAKMYLQIYARGMHKEMNAILVAPCSSRGWGHIGNSLIFSTISKVQRLFPVNPDRIYITGQSMGGHLSYRAALSLPDRWGAVSPHSGGYDYVAKKAIGNLINVPGYAIWGVREPYGINKDNRTNKKWGELNKLDWKFVEKNGGHTIYSDELPKVAKFFNDHPRDMYRKKVYMRQGGAMKFIKTWQIKTWPDHKVYADEKPLRWNMRHWIEVEPREDSKEPQTILAENLGENRIKITSQNVRRLYVYLHPKMVDMNKPVEIKVNGKVMFHSQPKVDPRLMFQRAREFDDRGRAYWSMIDLKFDTDQEVPMGLSEESN